MRAPGPRRIRNIPDADLERARPKAGRPTPALTAPQARPWPGAAKPGPGPPPGPPQDLGPPGTFRTQTWSCVPGRPNRQIGDSSVTDPGRGLWQSLTKIRNHTTENPKSIAPRQGAVPTRNAPPRIPRFHEDHDTPDFHETHDFPSSNENHEFHDFQDFLDTTTPPESQCSTPEHSVPRLGAG